MAHLDPKVALEGRRGTHAGTLLGIAVSSVCAFTILALLSLGGPIPFVIGLGLGLLPVPLLLAGVLALDRLEPEPARYLAFAFGWGAGGAIVLGIILEWLLSTFVIQPLLTERQGSIVTLAVVAPVVEESLKGLALFGLLWFRRQELNGPTDGIVYAGMVGLGFAAVENMGYYALAVGEGGYQLAALVVLRGIVTPFSHPAFTSLVGIGVAHAALASGHSRIVAPVAGWVSAVILHGLWNGLLQAGAAAFGVAYLVTLGVTVGLVVVTVADRRRIVGLIARYLPQYYPLGVVTPGDIEMLSDLRQRSHARAWAALVCGKEARDAVSDYQRAATELAMLHRRKDFGLADPEWSEQRRVGLLVLMGSARESFPDHYCRATPPWAGPPPAGSGRESHGYGSSGHPLPDFTGPTGPTEPPDEPRKPPG